MKNLVWFLLGIAGGFIVAHFMNKDPRGHELLAEVDARITEFTDRIGDAYREQEARFAGGRPEMEHDRRARLVQAPADRGAHALGAAGDQYDLAFQAVPWCPPVD